MPIPKPKGGESQNDYVSRCMSWMDDNEGDKPQKQQIAICYNTFRESKGLEKATPAQFGKVWKAYLFRQLAVYKSKLQTIAAKQSEEEKIEGIHEDLDEPDKSKTGENVTDTD